MNKPISPENLLQFNAAIAQIRASFLVTLQAHCESLGELLPRMTKNSRGEDAILQAGIIAHKISGVAGTLQLSDLGQAAARAEKISDRLPGTRHSDPIRTEVVDAMSDLYRCIFDTCNDVSVAGPTLSKETL